jgi:polyhydroxybutyrate depolymerase
LAATIQYDFDMQTSNSLALLSCLMISTALLAQKPGTQERTLEIGKSQREYLLHIPRGFSKNKNKKNPAPLLLMLHGRTSNGKQAASSYYGWKQLADKEGFVAVFPTALGTPTSWRPGYSSKATTDTTFLTQLIDEVIEELQLDKERVFMTGHSSGGFMSYSYAAMHPDKVAAIGPVAGLNISRITPKVPVSVISFHGMQDDVVPYGTAGGKTGNYGKMPSAIGSAAAFATHNHCAAKPVRTELHGGKVFLDTWANGDAGTSVQLYSIKEWKHGWPNGRSKVSATKLIWEFFESCARQPKGKKSAGKKRRKSP